MRVALVHDFLTQRGGAERVVLALHRMFPSAPIFTSLYDPEGTFPEFGDADIRPSRLQRLPHRGDGFRRYLPLYPVAFGRLRLRDYDLTVTSSSHFAHGTRIEGGFHLAYCHTPPRWLYGNGDYFGAGGPAPGWTRRAVAPLLAGMRRWDRRAATRPHLYVANSWAVAERIRRLYGRNAPVIPPPVDVERFPAPAPSAPEGSFYLVVARLLPYKRIDLALQACAARGARLVVVGDGPARRRLAAAAGPSVTFHPTTTEAELTDLYRGCRALLQCGEEDFGIAPLEANAAGRPVVALAAGGALETVVDGTTGILFREPSAADLSAALDRLEGTGWDPAVLRRHAETFAEDRFRARIAALVSAHTEVAA